MVGKPPLSEDKIKQVQRLRTHGITIPAICAIVGVGRSCVRYYTDHLPSPRGQPRDDPLVIPKKDPLLIALIREHGEANESR